MNNISSKSELRRLKLIEFITRNVDLYINEPQEFIKFAYNVREMFEEEMTEEDNGKVSAVSVAIFNALERKVI